MQDGYISSKTQLYNSNSIEYNLLSKLQLKPLSAAFLYFLSFSFSTNSTTIGWNYRNSTQIFAITGKTGSSVVFLSLFVLLVSFILVSFYFFIFSSTEKGKHFKQSLFVYFFVLPFNFVFLPYYTLDLYEYASKVDTNNHNIFAIISALAAFLIYFASEIFQRVFRETKVKNRRNNDNNKDSTENELIPVLNASNSIDNEVEKGIFSKYLELLYKYYTNGYEASPISLTGSLIALNMTFFVIGIPAFSTNFHLVYCFIVTAVIVWNCLLIGTLTQSSFLKSRWGEILICVFLGFCSFIAGMVTGI